MLIIFWLLGGTMRISKIFYLNKSQYELDFVDIDTEKDIPLFMDPYFISKCDFPFAYDSYRTIKSFFEYLLKQLKSGNINYAKELFSHLTEPNEFCLGLSKGIPDGKGIGPSDSERIFYSLLKSKAFESGLMEDIEDFRIFIEGIDKDKMSDMTANIIKCHLIKYTQNQCKFLGIPLTAGVTSGYFWDMHTKSWENKYTDMLVIKDRKIILVPKRIVSYSKEYTPEKYVQHFILNFLQNEHLRLRSSLVQRRKNREKTPFVTKKSVREDIGKVCHIDKQWIARFTEEHPDVFDDFKSKTAKKLKKVENTEITDERLINVCEFLIEKLKQIDSGPDNATDFHHTVAGILELIFYPNLCNPIIEEKIHDGRKRIDVVFDNCAEEGFFFRLCNTHGIPSRFIVVECKNYTREIANPELDQIAGRFSPNRGQIGLIVCRKIENINIFMDRCFDTYKDQRGLIIPLTDDDLINILNGFLDNDYGIAERLLQDRFHKICIK